MKKICVEEVPEDLSQSHFFSFELENFFSKCPDKIFVIILSDIIG